MPGHGGNPPSNLKKRVPGEKTDKAFSDILNCLPPVGDHQSGLGSKPHRLSGMRRTSIVKQQVIGPAGVVMLELHLIRPIAEDRVLAIRSVASEFPIKLIAKGGPGLSWRRSQFTNSPSKGMGRVGSSRMILRALSM
jgi:hypothetical protein